MKAIIEMADKAEREQTYANSTNFRKAIFNPKKHDLLVYFEDEDISINVTKSVWENTDDTAYLLKAALRLIDDARAVYNDDERDCNLNLYQFLQACKQNSELYDWDFATENGFQEVERLADWAEELCEEIGYISSDMPRLIRNNIDFQGIADDLLEQDYNHIEMDNGNYLIWSQL